MRLVFSFESVPAQNLITQMPAARRAAEEVKHSIVNNTNLGDKFVLCNAVKNGNGVVPIKEGCYDILENEFSWCREKPLKYFQQYKNGRKRLGGPIDAYKNFDGFRVGLEFETGNISSAHRSMNKLLLAMKENEIDFAFMLLPTRRMSPYITDRAANYEELEPYFKLVDEVPFVCYCFDADEYGPDFKLLPKGRDGMSPRTIRKWQSKYN